ncbi:MAG: hypothetical protein HKN25_03075 [Pyrinomonadaceae bacterium]|nr:hypothetical protein [Pyrinomonadaceae bacterium]
MNQGNNGLFLLAIYVFLAIYLLPIFPNGGSENDLTRWASTASLVENNSFEISWTKDLIDGDFADVIESPEGEIYSKNPPGITILSAPFYALTRVIIGKPTRENVRTSWFVMRFAIGSLPLIFFAFWLLNHEVDAYSVGILLFATPLFPYSLLYYSHVLVAILVYLAFRAIYDTPRVFPERCFIAGLLLGFSLICEYSALVPIVVFGLGLLFTEPRDRFRRILFYLSGIAPFFFVLALYNRIVFGSALSVFSQNEIIYPTLSGIYQLLVSPSHGLFVWSPVLIFSVFAFVDSEERGFKRHIVKIFTCILTFAAVCGFSEKYGGASIGARHLIIIIPLLLDSIFDGDIDNYPSLWRGFFFTVSFLLCTIPILTYPFAPTELQFPHNSFWQPLLYETNWFTLTMANTFGVVNNVWTILPAMILLLLAVYFVWRDAKFPFKFAVGVLAGFLLVGNYMFLLDFEADAGRKAREEVVQQYKD